MTQTKKSESELGEIGGSSYINPNCWLAKAINAPPVKRCWYCETTFQKCPAFRYLIVTLILIPLSLSFIFLTEGRISRTVILSLFIFIISYGYLFNKSTEELVITNFSLKKIKRTLEKSKSNLEIRVRARTKDLRELANSLEQQANSLEQQVKEKTKELQKRVEELERFRKFSIDRELRMVELKKEIKKLKEELGKGKT